MSDRVRAEWLSDGRSMRLTRTLRYEDSKGVVWVAPDGAIVDGATIPRLLQLFIGSPYGGKYRRASVFHDVYCKKKSRASYRVHFMFFQIMIQDEVAIWKALAMWLGVTVFGPTFLGREKKIRS